MRLIDADAFLEEARNRIDMQDVYLPIHIKELVIDEMSTIEAEPTKYGKWTITECFDVKDMTCSYCGWLYEYHAGMEEEWNYCPHCGARMEGE